MARGWRGAVVAMGVGLGAAWASGAAGATGEGGRVEELSALGFFQRDVEAMQRTAEAFYGELGEVGGQGDEGEEGEGGKRRVEFFVLRGSEVEALSPDLQGAVGGRRAVCIGQYRAGGVDHRVLYSLDDPPVRLGDFRMEVGGRWAECTDGMPVPDTAAEKKEEEGEGKEVPVRFRKRGLPGPVCGLVWMCLDIMRHVR